MNVKLRLLLGVTIVFVLFASPALFHPNTDSSPLRDPDSDASSKLDVRLRVDPVLDSHSRSPSAVEADDGDGADADTDAHTDTDTDNTLENALTPPVAPCPNVTCKSDIVACTWPLSSGKFAKRVTSQGMQDGLIEYIFSNIGETNRYFVEFGFDKPSLKGATPNTGQLRARGWNGLLLDGKHNNPKINLHAHFLTASNILDIFAKYDVPLETDFVSIDLDSDDIWIFRVLASSRFKPRVISVEYNCFFPLQYPVAWVPGQRWKRDRSMASSLGALILAAQEVGYELVAVEPCMDAFFVRADQIRGCKLATWRTWQKYTGHSWVWGPPPKGSPVKHLDYVHFMNTGNLAEAKKSFLVMCGAMKEFQKLDFWHGGLKHKKMVRLEVES